VGAERYNEWRFAFALFSSTLTFIGDRNMTLAEVRARLSEDGITVPPHRIHHAVAVGHVDAPEKDGSGRRVYSNKLYRQLRKYFETPRTVGRKPALA